MVGILTTATLALISSAMAQLLNCAEVPQCPMENGLSKCRVDGRLMTAVGVGSFSSSLSQSNLTWTVTYSQKLNGTGVDERRYYLGYPPELDFQALSPVSSCALFFTGIEAGLSFVGGDYTSQSQKGPTPGTCDDALGTTCVADLMQQAQGLAISNQDCTTLTQTLQVAPPTSCTRAGNWGDIVAIPLNGTTPVQITNCHPTSNSTYDLASVALFPELFPHDYFNDVTPLMTVFMSPANSSGDTAISNLSGPEVHLNCMKPLNVARVSNDQGFTGAAVPSIEITTALMSLVVGLQSLLWLA